MSSTLFRNLALAMLVASSFSVQASPIDSTPSYTTFGPLSGATFGGSGIPNGAVAITNLGGLTLGLTAHQRFVGANLANDGAGTFYAQPGAATPTGSSYNGSLWNFAYYINGDVTGYTFKLLYDIDPSAGTNFGEVDAAGHYRGTTLLQDSQNLLFNLNQGSFLNATSFTPPAGTFDPFAVGQYSFDLIAYKGGQEAGRSAINVNVGVPEPATIALFGLGLLGFAVTRRKSKKSTNA